MGLRQEESGARNPPKTILAGMLTDESEVQPPAEARPAQSPFRVPLCASLALLTPSVKSRHAIAVLSALKSGLFAATGGKGA